MASSTNDTGNADPATWFASLILLDKAQKLFFTNWSNTAHTMDEESIHDLRVASRRLREALKLFSPVLPSRKVARLSNELKQVTRMLGELRNADEAHLFFSGLDAKEGSRCRPELDQLLETLDGECKRARKELSERMKNVAIGEFSERTRSLINRPNLFKPSKSDPFDTFRTFAASALARRADRVALLLPKALVATDSASQHALRIAVKKMRYRLESMEPMLGTGVPLRDALKSYQDVLGKLHDVDVFGEMVTERVPEGDGREELQRVLARRRRDLFAGFLDLVERVPLLELAEETRARL